MMDSELENIHGLYEGVLDEPAGISSSFEEVGNRLIRGERGIIVDVPWDEKREDYFQRHQLVLLRIEGDRLYYINPLPRPEGAIGEVGGSPGAGPLRRLEPNGEESIGLELFRTIFSAGGRALLSNP